MKVRNLGLSIFVLVVALGAGALGIYLSPVPTKSSLPAFDTALKPTYTNSYAPTSKSDLLGQPAPDFALLDATGSPRRISDWQGYVRVINFWASWCIPCRHEIPILLRIQTAFRGRGLRVLGITFDEHERAEAFAKEVGVNYPLLYGHQKGIAVSRALGNVAGVLPYTVVLDRFGVVRGTHLGIVDEEKLKALLEIYLSDVKPMTSVLSRQRNTPLGHRTDNP